MTSASPTRRLLTAVLLAFIPTPTSVYAGLNPGDVVVITDAGLFHHDGLVGSTAVLLAPASAFGGLSSPAIEWSRQGDALLICSGAQLLRVTVTGTPPSGVTIQDITPTVSGGLVPLYFDLDIQPATGDLFALDRNNGLIYQFQPPFSLGMAPTASVAVAKATRGMAVDSRTFPLTLVVSDSSEIRRIEFPSGTTGTMTLTGGIAVDCEPQIQNNAMVCRKNDHKIFGTTNSQNLTFDINLSGFCKPVALGPVDGEWDPIKRRLFVLAEEGVSPCAGAYAGGNHIVRFQVPGGGPNPPLVITSSGGSGIFGGAGDLCVIHDDFAFSGIYGQPCSGGGGSPILDQVDALSLAPEVGNAAFAMDITGALPGAPAVLLVGTATTDVSLLPCPLQVIPLLIVPVGNVAANGALALPAPIPNQPVLIGLDAYLQAAIGLPNGASQLTPGLLVHLGK